MTASPRSIREHCEIAMDRIRRVHLRKLAGSEDNVVYISDTYPGVWLEHVLDGVAWAELSGQVGVAKAQADLFLRHQKADGQLPCLVWESRVGYGMLQECVSFGSLCADVFRLTGDRDFLRRAYDGAAAWDGWLCRNRMRGRGLIEMYCGFDSGHDRSGRLDGMKYPGSVGTGDAASLPEGCPVAPMAAPDLNAVFYGNRRALAEMAALLGREDEAGRWNEKADEVKRALLALCRGEDGFFYDVDKEGRRRPCRSIAITNVFTEHLLERDEVQDLYERFFRDPSRFGTPFPYPSVAADDPAFGKRYDGNCWGYYCQGLTMLRSLRWMSYYGLDDEMHRNMEIWLDAWTDAEVPFGQELDPFTGAPSVSSPWYSSTMLFYLHAARELGYWKP